MHFLHILLAAVLMVVIHAAAIEPVNLVAEESVQQPQRERMSEAVRQIRRGVFSTEAAHIGEKIDVTKLVQDVLREAGILNPDLLAGIPEYRGYGGPGEIGGPEGTGGPVEPGKTPISGRYRGVRVPVGYGGYRYRRSGVLDRSGGDGGYGILLGIGGRGGNGGSGGHGGHAGHGLFGGIGGNGGRGGSGGNGGNGGDGLFGATGGNGGDGGSREDGTDGGTGAYFWDGRNGVNGAG